MYVNYRSADFTRASSYSLHMFHDNPGKTLVSQSQAELETLIQKSEQTLQTSWKREKDQSTSASWNEEKKEEKKDSFSFLPLLEEPNTQVPVNKYKERKSEKPELEEIHASDDTSLGP